MNRRQKTLHHMETHLSQDVKQSTRMRPGKPQTHKIFLGLGATPANTKLTSIKRDELFDKCLTLMECVSVGPMSSRAA